MLKNKTLSPMVRNEYLQRAGHPKGLTCKWKLLTSHHWMDMKDAYETTVLH